MAKKTLRISKVRVGYATKFVSLNNGVIQLPIPAIVSAPYGVNIEIELIDEDSKTIFSTREDGPHISFNKDMLEEYFKSPYSQKEFNVFNEGETGIELSYRDQGPLQDYYKCLKCGSCEILSSFSYCPDCGSKIVESEQPFE